MESLGSFKKGALVVVFLFFAGTAPADTITVGPGGPGGGYDYATIQEGVDAAVSGADTVVVADGIYTGDGNRDIYINEVITVRSENGPSNCIIDCNGTASDPHWAFSIGGGVLQGFTITGGFDDWGGAITCSEYTKIINCIFHNNTAQEMGGAIWIIGTCSPTGLENEVLINCTFYNNFAGVQGGAVILTGGGGAKAALRNCIVSGVGGLDTLPVGKCGFPSIEEYYTLLDVMSDPCFADPFGGDFHLHSEAGRWDPNSESWVVDANTSVAIDAGDPCSNWSQESRPNGERINIGAYGGTPQASLSPGCFPSDHPDYYQWVSVGAPSSWCYPRQCHGDADGQKEPIGKAWHWVGFDDLDIFLEGFGQLEYIDPMTDPWIAADFNHQLDQIGKAFFRVGYGDLDIFVANFAMYPYPEPDCLDVP